MSFHYALIFLITLIACIGSGGAAFAQNTNIPSSAKIERFEDEMNLKRESDLLTVPRKASIETPKPSTEAVPEGAENILFTLGQIRIEGNTTYAERDLRKIWEDDIGKEISVQRLYDISAAITARYRKDGYILSRAYIPAQEIDSGHVTINVVEGFISKISYEGENGERSLIKQIFKNIKVSKPIDIYTLERNLLLLNDLSGVSYRAVLQTVAETEGAGEGAVALHLVEEKTSPFSGSLEVNNSGSEFIGPYMTSAHLGYEYSGLMAFHRTDLMMSATIPTDELKYISLSHSMPLSCDGLSLVLDASHSLGNPGHTLKRNDIESRVVSAGMHVEWKAVRQRDQNLTFSVGANLQNSATDIMDQKLSRDHIRSLDFETSYSWDDLLGNETPYASSNSITLTFEKGFENIFGGSERGDLDLTRSMGHPDYEVLKATAFRLQQMPFNTSMLLGFSGQLASGPLLSSQEFGYGGSTFGRAYDPSELVGDEGFAASFELRHNYIPLPLNLTVQPFVYADFGKVWNRDAGQPKNISGATAGGGIRLALPYNINANFTVAQPLTKSVDTPQYGNGKNPRYLFSLSGSF